MNEWMNNTLHTINLSKSKVKGNKVSRNIWTEQRYRMEMEICRLDNLTFFFPREINYFLKSDIKQNIKSDWKKKWALKSLIHKTNHKFTMAYKG